MKIFINISISILKIKNKMHTKQLLIIKSQAMIEIETDRPL